MSDAGAEFFCKAVVTVVGMVLDHNRKQEDVRRAELVAQSANQRAEEWKKHTEEALKKVQEAEVARKEAMRKEEEAKKLQEEAEA